MKELLSRNVTGHAAALEAGEYSSVELTRAFLDNIDPDINAYISVAADSALKQAADSDARRRAGEIRGALDGIPYAAKDNIAVRGVRLTCGSRMLENYISPYDATVIERLASDGAVLLGKTNLDEFAMGTGNESSYFGRVKNPLDRTRVPGGSSGGSAAAVSAGETCFALGSDTGGSVRQPAAFCGLVALRPTYSLLSRYGLVAFAPSLDTVGIIARSTEDCGILLDSLSARDPRDSTTYRRQELCLHRADPELRGMRFALVKEVLESELNEEVRRTLMRSANILSELGATVVEVSLPSLRYAYAAYYTISSAEVASNLARFDGVRYGFSASDAETVDELYISSRSQGFGGEVKRRILFGATVRRKEFKSDLYDRAILTRRIISEELKNTLQSVDALLLPTSADLPYKTGERKNSLFDANTKGDLLCAPASLAGLPALSIPCLRHALPTSVQLVGAEFSDGMLLAVGKTLMEAL